MTEVGPWGMNERSALDIMQGGWDSSTPWSTLNNYWEHVTSLLVYSHQRRRAYDEPTNQDSLVQSLGNFFLVHTLAENSTLTGTPPLVCGSIGVRAHHTYHIPFLVKMVILLQGNGERRIQTKARHEADDVRLDNPSRDFGMIWSIPINDLTRHLERHDGVLVVLTFHTQAYPRSLVECTRCILTTLERNQRDVLHGKLTLSFFIHCLYDKSEHIGMSSGADAVFKESVPAVVFTISQQFNLSSDSLLIASSKHSSKL
ncbi:hypothetical protein DL96DRAFT_1704104 [Flagelloscypha sp. PMI_526]|nr:hypothetical protein DL96DRAFT_1704104 [Flagelloscypha sp. PMI_526]